VYGPHLQLKSIILACTELKYQEEDIYQLSSVDISRVLRQLNENNNRLIDQKGETSNPSAPSTPSPSQVATTTGTESETNGKPVTLFASTGNCQLFRVPRQLGNSSVVSSTDTLFTLPVSTTSANNSSEKVHRIDHAYSTQTEGGGSLQTSSVVVVVKGVGDVAGIDKSGSSKEEIPSAPR
jgi:hypothetical protein